MAAAADCQTANHRPNGGERANLSNPHVARLAATFPGSKHLQKRPLSQSNSKSKRVYHTFQRCPSATARV